jgi:hypothetical protein
LKAVKAGMSATNFASPIVSAISSDARVWYVTILNQTNIGFFAKLSRD